MFNKLSFGGLACPVTKRCSYDLLDWSTEMNLDLRLSLVAHHLVMQVDAEILFPHLQISYTPRKGLTPTGGPVVGPESPRARLRLGVLHSSVVTHFLLGPGIWKTNVSESAPRKWLGHFQSLKGAVLPGQGLSGNGDPW